MAWPADIKKLYERITYLLDTEENAEIWFNAPHPSLGGKTPWQTIIDGNIETVDTLIYCIEVGQPD